MTIIDMYVLLSHPGIRKWAPSHCRVLSMYPILHLSLSPTGAPSYVGKWNLAASVVENVCRAQAVPETSQPLLLGNPCA